MENNATVKINALFLNETLGINFKNVEKNVGQKTENMEKKQYVLDDSMYIRFKNRLN